MDENKMTVLEGILEDVTRELFQRWANNLPQEQQTEEVLEPLSKNAKETTTFVVQSFMNKFNAAADELKDK